MKSTRSHAPAESAVVDRIIRHLTLTFIAEKPPPAHVFAEAALMAAGEYE